MFLASACYCLSAGEKKIYLCLKEVGFQPFHHKCPHIYIKKKNYGYDTIFFFYNSGIFLEFQYHNCQFVVSPPQ